VKSRNAVVIPTAIAHFLAWSAVLWISKVQVIGGGGGGVSSTNPSTWQRRYEDGKRSRQLLAGELLATSAPISF